MAKRLKLVKQTNGYNEEQVKSFVSEIEDELDKIATGKGEYMAFCKNIRGRIQDVYKTANGMGIDKDALKAVIAARAMERKIAMARDGLDHDGRDNYDLIRQALGDFATTALGEAALRVERGMPTDYRRILEEEDELPPYDPPPAA
jgi:uncharacterized protein (UPF0335 family)